MRILYLCHRIPYPPNKGEKIRAFHQLRALAERHDVDLFTLALNTEEVSCASGLHPYCRHVTVEPPGRLARNLRIPWAMATGTPLTLPFFYSSALRQTIWKAFSSRSYDLVFVYSSSMAQYTQGMRDVPVVLDLVDVDSDKWFQFADHCKFPMAPLYRREGRTLRAQEREICESAALVLVSTDREAAVLRAIAPSAKVQVVSNGVDADYFAPAPSRPEIGSPVLIFTGAMDYFPNAQAVIFFATKVFPGIRHCVPEARFMIVGSNPTRSVKKLGKNTGIAVTGYVEDVRPYLSQAHLFVAPLAIATGIQNKILEAMAMGLPVLASTRATQGLPPGIAGLVETASSPGQWVEKTVEFLKGRGKRGAEALAGRAKVLQECSWSKNLSLLLDLVESISGSDISREKARLSEANRVGVGSESQQELRL